MTFYKKYSFWENIKRSLALLSGGAVYTLDKFGVADGWMITAGIIAFVVALLSIWITDRNNNNIVDFFE